MEKILSDVTAAIAEEKKSGQALGSQSDSQRMARTAMKG